MRGDVLVILAMIAILARMTATKLAPPIWPPQFSALTFQNRSGALAAATLWYDWPRGGNIIQIQKQLNITLWDLEWTNGTSYFFDRQAGTCRELTMPVGILRPDWLDGASYEGRETVDTTDCHRWAKADFVTYWESVGSRKPVRWTFFDGAQFDVITFEVGATLPDELWQAPAACFEAKSEFQHTKQADELLLA